MLNPKALGLALGIFWSITMLLTTLISLYTGYGREMLEVMVSLYPGYSISPMGSLVGLIYGFIDGFVMGFILAWLYNKLEV
jgi:hypothetical protein